MRKNMLVIGDILAIAILTVIGFVTHGEVGASFLPRMAAAFFPALIGWFLLAPWFGLFNEDVAADHKLIWRVPLTMLFAAPLAVIIRAALLQSTALPIFALVFGATNALGLLVWRWIYVYLSRRK